MKKILMKQKIEDNLQSLLFPSIVLIIIEPRALIYTLLIILMVFRSLNHLSIKSDTNAINRGCRGTIRKPTPSDTGQKTKSFEALKIIAPRGGLCYITPSDERALVHCLLPFRLHFSKIRRFSQFTRTTGPCINDKNAHILRPEFSICEGR